MARVNRLMERRALRRAADQALLTSLDNVAPSQAGGPADKDFVYRGSDRASTHDYEPATEPIPVAAVEEFAPEADSVELPPEQPVDIYDLMPDQTGDSEWDDVGLAQAADHAVTASTDDYGWLERDDVLPLAPSAAPESASRRRTRLLRACSRLRRVRHRALVSHEAGDRRACRSSHRRRGVRRLAAVPQPGHHSRRVECRRGHQCTAVTEHGGAHSGQRSETAAVAPTASPAAVGSAHLFRPSVAVLAELRFAESAAEAEGRRHPRADERRTGAEAGAR